MADVNVIHENDENTKNKYVKKKLTYNIPTFNHFDLFCILFSFGTFIADISTGEIIRSFVFVLCSTGVFPTTYVKFEINHGGFLQTSS